MANKRKTPRALAKEAFPNSQQRDYADEYLNALREGWRETSAAANRTVVLIILCIAVFELLIQAAIDKVSVGGFEIKDLTSIRLSLPVLIAFFYYELNVTLRHRLQFEQVHDAIMENLHPHIANNNLHHLLVPHRISLFGPRVIDAPDDPIHGGLIIIIASFYIFGTVVWEIYAYIRQFDQFGFKNVGLWIAAVLSLLLLLAGLYVLWRS